MKRRSCLLLVAALLCSAFAAAQDKVPTWEYFILNNADRQGLVFQFENPTEAEATVTFTVTVDGRVFTKTVTVKTDRVHNRGAGIVRFVINDDRTLDVLSVSVRMGRYSGFEKRPHTTTHYALAEDQD